MIMTVVHAEEKVYMIKVVVHTEDRGDIIPEYSGDMMMLVVIPTQFLTSKTE